MMPILGLPVFWLMPLSFALTFVREQNVFWGLQQAQIIALLTLAASLIAIVYFTRVKRSPVGLV
ncbi:MAG: hypothetical protein Q8O05_05475 [Chloroflexota bacterium]|nr:hypothetical protein [Chloroflexota bacterium]